MTYVYGKNVRLLRKIYKQRQGNGKGLNGFINTTVFPLAERNEAGEWELSDDKAWWVVQGCYPAWLERQRLHNWQEVAEHVDFDLYCSGGSARCFNGSYSSSGKKNKAKVLNGTR